MQLMTTLRAIYRNVRSEISEAKKTLAFRKLHHKYKDFTMIPAADYVSNLCIVSGARYVEGCVIECGVWRGGMSAGIADLLGPEREYFLFDSFEGLPLAQHIDGSAALAWQADKTSPQYFDNCKAEIDYARKAMEVSGATKYQIIKGWFEETLPSFQPPCPIAVLRLDADWYSSTMVCLQSLFKYMAEDGVVILDDYYTWDGCSKAVHDFFSTSKTSARIMQPYGICVLRPGKKVENEEGTTENRVDACNR